MSITPEETMKRAVSKALLAMLIIFYISLSEN
jgi:hypothetical protein